MKRLFITFSLLFINLSLICETTLSVTPSSFSIETGKYQNLIATLLDSLYNPLSGKTIEFEPSANFYPDSVVTNSSGQASTYYWAKWEEYDITMVAYAYFESDSVYLSSSDSTVITITETTDGLVYLPPPVPPGTGPFDPLHQGDLPGSPQAPQQTVSLSENDIPPYATRLYVQPGSFIPDEFTVKKNYLVFLVLTSLDGAHVFKFTDPSYQGVAIGVAGGQTRGIPFLPMEVGDYIFYCDVPGHQANGEEGVIHVIEFYPTASFSSDIQSGCASTTFNFTDQSTSGTGSIIEWYWDFGDGADTTYTSYIDTIRHMYQNPGIYTVSLTVNDENGYSDTDTKIDYITVYSGTSIGSGNVNGNWALENSPYYINGEITIPDSQTLTIEPGVEVIFNDYFKFNVQGRLLAIGTQTDSISFTVADTSGFSNFSWGNTDGGWGGIKFDNTPSTNDSSKIVFSKLQYCKANPALEFRYYDKVLINYCLLDNNASVSYWKVIDCSHSSPIFKDVIISNSRGYAIYCSYSNSSFENVTLTNGGCHIQFSNSNITLDNVTVSNNDSDSMEGGIINCDNSTINISNSTVSNNTGRGIFITDNSNASIINSNIFGNYGGGILCSESDLSLLNVNIYNNNAGYLGGGGIKIYVNSVLNISNVTINNNSAHYGGGIYFDSAPNFNSISNFNIYNNIAVCNGSDLYNDTSQIVHIVVDTFTVSNPTDSYAYPINKFTFDILHGLKTLIDSDLYVDPVNGNNENTGITSDSPFLTIGFALDNIFYNSSDIHIIYLLDGIYSPSTNGEVFPINCLSYVSLAGTEEGPVILDAEESNTVIKCTNVHDLSIENIILTNGLSSMGGGFYCNNNYNLNLSNLLIYGSSSNKGGGLHCCASYLTLTNVTSVRNEAIFGGGMYCWQGTSVNLINCIFYYDLYSDEVYFAPYNYYYAPCQITVSYSNIQGGESAGIVTNNWGTVNWLDGNIDYNPMFVDPDNGDYRLQTSSPCIDAGNPDTTGLNLPDYDLDGNPRIVNGIIDMGCYEYQGGTLSAPTNITISISSDSVHIEWDAVTGANSYKIYASDDPYTGFDSLATVTDTIWSTSITEVKKFYYVKASTETIRSKDSGSQDAYHPGRKSRRYDSDKFIKRKRN